MVLFNVVYPKIIFSRIIMLSLILIGLIFLPYFLQNSIKYTIYIYCFFNEKDLDIKLTREDFEEICKDQFKNYIDIK